MYILSEIRVHNALTQNFLKWAVAHFLILSVDIPRCLVKKIPNKIFIEKALTDSDNEY